VPCARMRRMSAIQPLTTGGGRTRVLWLTVEPPWPPTSGGRLRTAALLRAAAARYDVTLALLFGETPADRGPLAGVAWAETPAGRAGKASALARLVSDRRPPYLRHFSTPGQRRAVARALDRERFDLIVADMPYAVEALPAVLPAPLLVNTQNVEAEVWRAALPATSGGRALLALDRRWIPAWERSALGRADGAAFCSALDEAALRPALRTGCLTAVVPNAVDTEVLQPLSAPPARNEALFVGGLGYGPNREAAEFIARELAPAASAVGVTPLIVGGAAAELDGPADGVVFLGRPPEVRSAYERAYAVIVPLFSGGGTRLKVLEAFAYGRPVVATAKAVEGLDVVDGVHYLRAESAAEFVARLATLRDPEVAAPLVAAARSLVEERYSARVAGSSFVAFMDRIVEHHADHARPRETGFVHARSPLVE
jgi:glycosyltransferase involved in cell wall biosynthesis